MPTAMVNIRHWGNIIAMDTNTDGSTSGVVVTVDPSNCHRRWLLLIYLKISVSSDLWLWFLGWRNFFRWCVYIDEIYIYRQIVNVSVGFKSWSGRYLKISTNVNIINLYLCKQQKVIVFWFSVQWVMI